MADIAIPANQREFRCVHCDGKIRIPRELPPTTAPCPICAGIITSPADEVAPLPLPLSQLPIPQKAPVPVYVEQTAPSPHQKIPATPVTVERPRIELPPPRNTRPERAEPVETSAPEAETKPERSGLIAAMLVLLLLACIAYGVVFFASKELGRHMEGPTVNVAAGDPTANEANYIRIGWQKDAYKLLRNYMAATNSKDKIPYILHGSELASRLEDFYGGGAINDSDTPVDAFSIYELSEEDRKRGLFMMIYDQPPQFDMKEFFRPLASLEVQYGVDEADLLLSTVALVGNFAMEPLRVHAFFKRTPEGLKLDWEIFSQTKYRTLQNFVELPEVGQSRVFRVFIVEDVPEKGKAVAGSRTYRVADPANTGDTARVNVKVDSEMGRALSIINWRGTKEDRPITRTATVELKWAGEASAPELEISRFMCWEFLGLGGQETPATASTK